MDFARAFEPLTIKLNDVLKGKGRKIERAAKVGIELSDAELNCFKDIKKKKAKATTMAHPSQDADFFDDGCKRNGMGFYTSSD